MPAKSSAPRSAPWNVRLRAGASRGFGLAGANCKFQCSKTLLKKKKNPSKEARSQERGLRLGELLLQAAVQGVAQLSLSSAVGRTMR